MERYEFEHKDEFVAKLKEIVASGVAAKKIQTFTPYHVHEVDHLLHFPTSPVRFFQGAGAVFGFVGGWLLTLGTVYDWPLITGGKPLASIPPFLVIAYEMTILFGCLGGFLGLVYLARFPVVEHLFAHEKQMSRRFEIVVED